MTDEHFGDICKIEDHITEPVMREVRFICRAKRLKITFAQSLQGGLFAGSSAMLGGLLGGPLWLAIGATLGGVYAACNLDNGIRQADEVVMELNEHERVDLVSELFRTVAPSLRSVKTLARVIEHSPVAQDITVKTLRQLLLEKGMRLSYEDVKPSKHIILMERT